MKYLLLLALFSLSCQSADDKPVPAPVDLPQDFPANEIRTDSVPARDHDWLYAEGETVQSRFLPNPGFARPADEPSSWAAYLRRLPLKPDGANVLLFDGEEKYPRDVHAGVIDVSVGKTDLQQCADAIMRLRSEYLYENSRFGEISFNFVNGFAADYSRWRAGDRIRVNGNGTVWRAGNGSTPDRKSFDRYLQYVFMYANTASLEKQLLPQPLAAIEPGFVFIQGGFPGHAVLVVDLAVNGTTGEKEFLLAQSYMPAQDIHVLRNPARADGNPWYRVEDIISKGALVTPEWTFGTNQLRKFQ